MPIYEYRCQSCGFQKEYLQKIGDASIASCPECGSASFNKMLSAAGFQLKGSGWYATDFKGKPKTDKKTSEESKEAKPASETEKKPATECGAGACPACE
ncbi:MAG: FmdB family zinc ribbon protein [Burkholderiales bacterium]